MTLEVDPKAQVKKYLGENDKPANLEQAIALINATPGDMKEEMEKLPNLNHGNMEEFGKSIVKALSHGIEGDLFRKLLLEGDWTNRPTGGENNTPIVPSKLRANDSANRSGEAAVLKVKALMGLGTIINVPLWHTGGWVSIKAPTNTAILELNRRIGEEKIHLGRLTNGMLFSNTSVYIQSYLINFVLAHIYDTNLPSRNSEELKKLILSTDLPSLVWGILCAMYPDGYHFREPCVANIGQCNHEAEGIISIPRMRVVDLSRLSDSQRDHMSQRNKKLTTADLEAYQSEFDYDAIEFTLSEGKGMKGTLQVPTLAEYEQSGFSWVDGIVEMADNAFAVPLQGSNRNAYITEQGRITTARQYSHWVKSITVPSEDGDLVYNDRATVDALCAELSNDDEFRANFLDGVGEHIERTSVVVIGYPNTACPKCGLRLGDTVEKGKDGEPDKIIHGEDVAAYIPIDITTTFFTLTGQRLKKTLETSL